MENLDLISLAGNFVIGAVFMWAWWQERKERQTRQDQHEQRVDMLTLRTLELVRDIATADERKRTGAIDKPIIIPPPITPPIGAQGG